MSFLFSQFRNYTRPPPSPVPNHARVHRSTENVDEQEAQETILYPTPSQSVSSSMISSRDAARTASRIQSDTTRKIQVAEQAATSTLQDENMRLKAEVERLEGAVRDRGAYKAEGRVKDIEEADRQKEARIQALEKRCSQLQQLLNLRTAELSEAQAYLIKPDEYPGSTILGMVEGLNSEIFNAATSISDLYEQCGKMDLKEMGEKLEFFNTCRTLAKAAIGEYLYSANSQIDEALGYTDPSNPEEPLPLQLALQHVLIQWCSHRLCGFGPSAVGQALEATYRMVCATEEPSVSAKWRVITAAAVSQQEQNPTQGVADAIMAVLCICGMSTVTEEFPKVRKKVSNRLECLEKIALKLRTAMREGITSSDMEVITVNPHAPFSPHTMKDIYSRGKKPDEEKQQGVLCTVGLGLQKTARRRDSAGMIQDQVSVMKMPEVVLLSTLESLRRDY